MLRKLFEARRHRKQLEDWLSASDISGHVEYSIRDMFSKAEAILNRDDFLTAVLRDLAGPDNISYFTSNSVIQDFGHFLSLPIPEIMNHRFDATPLINVASKFKEIEREWYESKKRQRFRA